MGTSTIKYGINKRDPAGRKKKILHQNHAIVLDLDGLSERECYRKCYDSIAARHPGWGVTGWAYPQDIVDRFEADDKKYKIRQPA